MPLSGRLRRGLLGWVCMAGAWAMGADACAAGAAAAARSGEPPRSGYADMRPSTQTLQDDDAQNPGWLWVAEGARRFEADCQRCHTNASMKGVAARHPRWDARRGRPMTLAQRIDACRTEQLGQPSQGPDSEPLLSLTAWVGLQSRGLPLVPDARPEMQALRAEGERWFRQPFGQLQLACAQCHDQAAGLRLAGSLIPQGHANGYPLYRLEWQGLGSFARRLRNCMTGVRAEPFAADSREAVALEAYLAQRARGLLVETPAVRP